MENRRTRAIFVSTVYKYTSTSILNIKIQELIRQNLQIILFDFRRFPPGHLPTNFTLWENATEPYQVEKEDAWMMPVHVPGFQKAGIFIRIKLF